ncbi:MAG: hypothetical protein KDD62_01720 [Bdellovibrionales bacterium]|nr:hypothetical protein [Bdellovibrionales bacterium]
MLRPHEAAVLTTNDAQQKIVAYANTQAQALGIAPGMSLAHAFACSERLQVAALQIREALQNLNTIAQKLHCFTPLVAFDPILTKALKDSSFDTLDEGYLGIILNMRGTQKYYKSNNTTARLTRSSQLIRSASAAFSKHASIFNHPEALQNILALITDFFEREQYIVRIGVAQNTALAWALAHYGSQHIAVQQKSNKDEARQLPVEALRIKQALRDSFHYYGIQHISELLSFSRRALAKRFGLELTECLQHILGESLEALHYILPKKYIAIRRPLAHPTQELVPLVKAITRLAFELHHRLTSRDVIPQQYSCWCYHEQKIILNKQFSLFRSAYTEAQLEQLLYQLFERCTLIQEVTSICVQAKHIHTLSKTQRSLNGQEDCIDIDYKEFLQRAAAIMENNQHFFITPTSAHVPEQAYQYSPQQRKRLTTNAFVPQECPTTMLYPPQEITALALLPEHAPARLSWKQFEYVIQRGLGPEKIYEQWWLQNERHQSRDYYKVLTHTGIWLWVFRSMPDHRWFLHGFWS